MTSNTPTYRAVLVGINYIGTNNALSGCINDVQKMRKFLKEQLGFLDSEITVLTDDQSKALPTYPSRANMLSAFRKVASEIVKAGDVLVVHYSGHGSYMSQSLAKRRLLQEDDFRDETICPADFQSAGMIIDDDLRAILVDPLPAGAILRVIFDQCHSATALDLRYTFVPATSRATGTGLTSSKNLKIGVCKADAKSLSGCKDAQTSADAFIDGAASGALTYSLLKTLKTIGPEAKCGQLVNAVNNFMIKEKYDQRPVLASGLQEIVENSAFFTKLKR